MTEAIPTPDHVVATLMAAAPPAEWLPSFSKEPEGYIYREFRREDSALLEGVEIDHPICGGTMEKDGKPAACAGVNLICGKHWVFFFIADPNLRSTLWLMRLMRDSLRAIGDSGIDPLYALCDARIPRAPEFLAAIGFRPMTAYEKSVDVLVYEGLMGAKAWIRHAPEKKEAA